MPDNINMLLSLFREICSVIKYCPVFNQCKVLKIKLIAVLEALICVLSSLLRAKCALSVSVSHAGALLSLLCHPNRHGVKHRHLLPHDALL